MFFYSYPLAFLQHIYIILLALLTDLLLKSNFEYKTSELEIRKSDDPVILILMDGLSSSEEIFKHTNDSIDLKLDYYLKNQGYKVIPNAKTESLRTTLSVPSLFNFNIHKSIDNDSIENIDKGLQKIDGFQDIFHENLLVDSLYLGLLNLILLE